MDTSNTSQNHRRKFSKRQKIALLLALVMAVGGAVYAWLFADLPPLERLHEGLALPSTRIFDRNGQLLYEILPPEQGRNTVIAFEDIPQHCINAVVATEDAGFYNHPGVDLVGVARAVWINLRGGEILAGGSTITQQLVRTVLLDPDQRAERSLERKLKEMILALRLQSAYSKQDTLALYLNQVYFGNLAYGIEGAARVYFGKSAEDLSLAECALLAGMIQNAALHDPLTNSESAKARQEVALNLMVQNGYISQAQADIAKTDDLQFASTRFPIKAPHFVMAVWKQLERDYPDLMYTAALDVVTTVDVNWQETAQRVAQDQLEYLNDPPPNERVPANARNAALVALDPMTGEVLAMLGSPDYFDESIDGAVNAALALRQPGSALKPFTYAAGMAPARENPITAATMFMDVRTSFVTERLESYVPSNYGFVEHGPVLVREALASSYNIPAVLALQQVGIEPMIELAANAGLETLINNPDLDLAVTLGGGEVRLLDLTQAYAAFANGGFRVEPVFIRSVTLRASDTSTAETLYEWQPPRLDRRVMDARIAYIITDILSDPDARLPAFGKPSLLDIGRPAAAKTGTTTNFRDNWVAGYTPELVVGVWVGNADNTPMLDASGITGAGPIWHDFMRRVTLGTPETQFTRPEGIISVKVCSLSGLLPTPLCPHTREELFIEGTQPSQPDNLYQELEIDAATGLLADASTPPEQRMRRVFVVLPQEAHAWAKANGLNIPPQTVSAPDAGVGLRLLSPDPYTVYQISPMQPIENQRLKFSAAAPPQTRSVNFHLNGEVIGTDNDAPFEMFWGLALGEYQLSATATTADGQTEQAASVTFSVVEYEEPQSRGFNAQRP